MPHLRRSSFILIPPRCTRPCLVTAVAVAGLLMLATAAAHAWDARTQEGTPAERSNTTTPTNMANDQCSLKVPDIVSGVYNFSWQAWRRPRRLLSESPAQRHLAQPGDVRRHLQGQDGRRVPGPSRIWYPARLEALPPVCARLLGGNTKGG